MIIEADLFKVLLLERVIHQTDFPVVLLPVLSFLPPAPPPPPSPPSELGPVQYFFLLEGNFPFRVFAATPDKNQPWSDVPPHSLSPREKNREKSHLDMGITHKL